MVEDVRIIAWFLRPYAATLALIFLFLFAFTALEAAAIGAFYPLLASVMPGASSAGGGRLLGLLDACAGLMPGADPVSRSSVLLLVLVTASAGLGFFAESFAMWHRYRLLEDFFNGVFRKLTANAYPYFLEKKQGELVYIGLNASQAVGEMLMYFPRVGVEAFRLLTIAVLLLTISPGVTLAVLGLMAVFGVVVHFISVAAIHPIAVRIQKADTALNAVFSEAMAGIKHIKVFDAAEHWRSLFALHAAEMRAASTRNVVYGFIPPRLIMLVGSASIALSILYVKTAAPDRFADFLPIVAIYVLALQRMMPAVNNIGTYWMGLKGLAPRLELTHRTLTEDAGGAADGGAEFAGLRSVLRLEGVSFAYPTRGGVLKDVTLEIPRGRTVAVVGESGSGKSTLADLLMRLYEPGAGRITVDGRALGEFSRSSWLARAAMVSQEPFIFHASIAENIRMGRRDATEAEVREAAETAFAHAFISELPEGYDTVVGDRGVKLSGGQRQRLAIARALLRRPELLVLDEATSALDNISEKAVQEALARSAEGRTTVVVAHRLSTVEKADKIVVLIEGAVAEEGAHPELLARGGAYSRLYHKLQGEAGGP